MFSATQIANFLACPHTATLDQAAARNEVTKPFFKDTLLELLQKLGLEHERRYLRQLTDKNDLVIIHVNGCGSWEDATAQTIQALRDGADVVYQGAFLDHNWGGRPDFLLRVEEPSQLGSWRYEVVETKLAHSTKATAVIQLCFYSDLLARVQGVEPERMHIVLGGGASPESFRVHSYAAFFRKVQKDFKSAWVINPNTYPEPNAHCNVCSWFPVCDAQWRKDDHLSLVAGISRNQRKALTERGVSTMAGLASVSLPPEPKIERIGNAALARIREQARMQVQGREENRLIYELTNDVENGHGLSALPTPSPADVFLDLEGNPYAFEYGLEYLVGMITINSDSEPIYEPSWSLTRAEEKRNFEAFVAKLMVRWREHPEMHVYHYAPYEPTAIKRLVGTYGVCVDEVDQLLRAGIFVDLFKIVRQSLRASVESYSIKRIEPFYNFNRAVPLHDANVALHSFEAAMALGTDQREIDGLTKSIEGYNRDDCLSLVRLRDWLGRLRGESELKIGHALARPVIQFGEANEQLSARLVEVHAVMHRLLALIPEDEAEWTNEHRACWLLAQMLEWHRREEKSSWWEYFRLCELSDAELEEERNALGGLVLVGEVARARKSVTFRYSFPQQDHSIDGSAEVHDPKTRKRAGQIEEIDEGNRTIDLRRSSSSCAPHPTALVSFDVVGSTVLRDSLLRIGSWVADHGISGKGEFQLAQKLLLREPPEALRQFIGNLIGHDEKLTASAKTLVHSLPGPASVLAIQGPPGSGKTFTGARMVIELLNSGKRVGITAASHKVISTLLTEICRAATEAGVTIHAIQKGNERDEYDHPCVTITNDNQEVLDALVSGFANLAAGSAWLWARDEMTNSLDVLIVDEAAQMSLANVLAISPAATSMVLLGDPQQLDQPQKGIHPPGAELSALRYLLDGRATIAADRGLFLSETRRLHPDVCAFTSEVFYEGRLVAVVENANQRLNAAGPLGGTGLRFIPVEHSGNQNDSPEEVEIVAECVNQLLCTDATWTNKHGETRALGLEDILIVAPYNAQVVALIERLPQGARVGTVDKFQGQEAPIIFYSMATSTPEDAPRGMEFLYSLNRLNVAVSRARCVAVIIASPALFQVQCKTPRQIELANAFCRYLEMVQPI